VALLIVFQSLPALISGFSTTKSSTGASSSIKEDVPYCWEAELLENAQPLSPAPPSLSASLEVLKRDGVVRLNSEAFRVDENLCATLRDRILAEIEKPNSFDSKPGDNYVDKYVPGTRLRPGERAMDLAFGGDARHDLLLPLNDENFSEVRPVLESAARQLEPLLLAAAEELLPRLHGSYKSSKENADENQIRVDSSSSELQRHDLSAEVVEVASLIVRQGSGHQNVHGDYRRFTGGNDCPKEEPLSHTEARDGKMPPRIVTFVALQDIPSDEHGATGFITGTHNSRSHGLIYGESATIDNENGLAQARQDVLQSSTRGVRTSRGFRRGEMLIYDASVLHWGGANLVPKNDRAILYFGVSRLNSAAQLGQSQPKLPGFEIVPPILLQDFVAPP
jgi:hypothetical protein